MLVSFRNVFLVAFLSLFPLGAGNAAAIKVGETILIGGGGVSGSSQGTAADFPTGVAFTLSESFPGETNCPDLLGCSKKWSLEPSGAETGIFDFNSSDAGFDSLVSTLTDNVDGSIFMLRRVFRDGEFIGGGGSGNLETGWLKDGMLLTGQQIDTIRLRVRYLRYEEEILGGGGFRYSMSQLVNFEFYTGTPAPAPVPVPASAFLFLGGFALLGAISRRRRRSL